jgi:hypothetical protein
MAPSTAPTTTPLELAPPYGRRLAIQHSQLRCSFLPSRKHFGNFSPSIAHCLMCFQNRTIFLHFPRFLTDIGIQVIVPTFSTLFANASRQIGGNQTPFLGTIFFHQFDNFTIFFGCPGSLDKRWFEYLLPTMQTLHFGTIGKTFGNALPILGPIFLHGRTECVVLM